MATSRLRPASSDWKLESIRLLGTGNMLSLRSLLAQVQIEEGLTYADVCKPSGYLYVGDKFVAKGQEYGKLKSVRKRMKHKLDSTKLLKQNRRMKKDLNKNRTVLADIKNTHRHFSDAQQNFGESRANKHSFTHFTQTYTHFHSHLNSPYFEGKLTIETTGRATERADRVAHGIKREGRTLTPTP